MVRLIWPGLFMNVTAILLIALWLGGCVAVPKQAFNPTHRPDIKTIAITVEYNHKLTIRRLNPVYAIIGASGLLMQQAAMEQKSSRYVARAGNIAFAGEHFILQELQSGLSRQGYKAYALHTDFWQAMKLAHEHRLPDIDAILRLKIERLGFRAGSTSAPYEPSLIVSAQMINPGSREILYEDTIAIGYKPSAYRMTLLDYNRRPYVYASLTDLLEHALQSKPGIFIALQHTAERIIHDLGKKRAPMLVRKDQEKGAPVND